MSEEPEPYTVLEVNRGQKIRYVWDNLTQGVKDLTEDLYYFNVRYRNYSRNMYFSTKAKDELEAFILGQKRLTRMKRRYDMRYGDKKKEQTT
jgi:hypothetical protein